MFDSAMTWTAALQASLSLGFSRQECCNGLPLSIPGDLLDPGIKPKSLVSPHWEEDALPLYLSGKFLKYACLGVSEMNDNENAKDRGRS